MEQGSMNSLQSEWALNLNWQSEWDINFFPRWILSIYLFNLFGFIDVFLSRAEPQSVSRGLLISKFLWALINLQLVAQRCSNKRRAEKFPKFYRKISALESPAYIVRKKDTPTQVCSFERLFLYHNSLLSIF